MIRRIHALRVGNVKAFADTQRIPVRDRVLQTRCLRFKEYPVFLLISKRYGRVCRIRPAGVIVEYALRDNSKPIGVAEYQIAQSLPENIEDQLPSIECIEQELQGEWDDEE
jgi:hypothetical protein